MDEFKKTALPFLILTLLVGLLISFRSFLMDNVIEPVALLCWAVWRIISSVDQNIYWIALIVICTILVVRLIPSEKDNSSSPALNQTYKPPNRVEYWQTLIDEAMLGKNKSEYLRYRMKELVMSIIAEVEQPATTEVNEMIATKIPSLSLAAHQYLFPPDENHGTSPMKIRTNITVFSPKWLRRWQRKYTHQNNVVLDEILKWMETELEINDEK